MTKQQSRHKNKTFIHPEIKIKRVNDEIIEFKDYKIGECKNDKICTALREVIASEGKPIVQMDSNYQYFKIGILENIVKKDNFLIASGKAFLSMAINLFNCFSKRCLSFDIDESWDINFLGITIYQRRINSHNEWRRFSSERSRIIEYLRILRQETD